jgi:hypothetical protein
MSKTSIRLPIVISLFLILFLAVIVNKLPVADSHSEGSKNTSGEIARAAEKGVANPPAGYASPQPAKGAEPVFVLASHRFEPLLLLLLGSTLLFIGSGIRLLLSRRLRRTDGLLKSDK